jgi:hypothetical protein
VLDMPVLYSLVRPDDQRYQIILEEESNSSKAGYASSTQARLALSFKTKLLGIFGPKSKKHIILICGTISSLTRAELRAQSSEL